jgi:ubiquinone/menaquinone biosynthesis C-methylase UbiE
MLTATFFEIVNRSPKGRRIVFRGLFEYLARRSQHMTTWTQMNYGYAEGTGRGHTIPLRPDEEHERYCHQLYFRTVNGVDLSGKDVAEVSCGRGGGSAFIHRYLSPRTMTGIDIAAGAIKFCRRVHRAPCLRFLQGEAEELPLFNESADALVNVEASFCYGDLGKFFSEVYRVLRPGGHFLYTDLHAPESIDGLISGLESLGFDMLHADDITANVSRALELDSERRTECVRANAPWLLRHAMRAFAGTPGSRIPTQLANGQLQYYCFTLRKRLGDTESVASSARSDVGLEHSSQGSRPATEYVD